MMTPELVKAALAANVASALVEDIGNGDITAALIPEDRIATARVITRDPMVLAGKLWVEATFMAVDPQLNLQWMVDEGQAVAAGSTLFEITGKARSLLTAERAALNFLQTLSATATQTRELAELIRDTSAKLLDTRKTLPGLRVAQKYAVLIGGGENHRMGLYDAFLIKENHIMAAGSIAAAINTARAQSPGKMVEVEVENHQELELALAAGADRIMLDNFSLEQMREAVLHTAGRAQLEASGGVNKTTLRAIAETGVDYISLGTLTKDIKAIDLSMRLI
ncbi:carboxylating nicotinate-nucleotide diphosphorylase [Perlucidibaca aquatica]|uniref:carboxylating nicotinate-nucleotide diphosphorylase n=1 Tax=Perlucidibaca aquatica TaxID=1852776 RepID=UPI00083A1F0F|nr:carboxylating nicotinate-nucleotide diphosphorylase [Perlucidibaca aquatica]